MKLNRKTRVVLSAILSLTLLISLNPITYAHNTNHNQQHNQTHLNINNINTANPQMCTEIKPTQQINVAIPISKPMTIKLTPEYIQCLKAYKANPNDHTNIAKLKAMNKKLVDMNPYQLEAVPGDEIEYDVNNLPYEIRVELSLMTADLVNSIRTQMQTEPVIVTQTAVEFADAIAKEYNKDKWSWTNVLKCAHDGMAIKKAAAPYSLYCPSDEAALQGQQWYEDFSASNLAYDKMSMGKLKESLYSSIRGFMFNGHEWDHATSIAGLDRDKKNNKCDYLGIAYGSYIGKGAKLVKDKFTGKNAWHGKDSRFGVHVINVHDELLPYCNLNGCPSKQFLTTPITRKDIQSSNPNYINRPQACPTATPCPPCPTNP